LPRGKNVKLQLEKKARVGGGEKQNQSYTQKETHQREGADPEWV